MGRKQRKRVKKAPAKTGSIQKKPMKINSDAVRARTTGNLTPKQIRQSYAPALTLGKPKEQIDALAMDYAGGSNSIYDFIGNSQNSFGMFGSAEFIGYAALSNLMQSGLVRIGPDVIADEMTRKWIQFSFAGEDQEEGEEDNSILEDIETEFTRLKVQSKFRDAEFFNNFFGGCLVYIDTGDSENPDELKTPLMIDKAKIKKGSVKRLQVVEPVNVYPGNYNSDKPLKADYFDPDTWFVLGQEVHKSRLLYFAANTPPLLLKPAYNFFGIPPVQMILDYTANFTDSRDSAARLLRKFSLTYIQTNMTGILEGGPCESLDLRMDLISKYRDNDSVIAMDKTEEEIGQVNTPISGVTDVVRQTLEFVAALWRIPTVKYLGISPGGFNSTGDSDFQNFYDHIHSLQGKRFEDNIQKLLEICQLNLGKEPDPNIEFKFVPLKEMSAKETAEINKLNNEGDAILVESAIVSQEEVRQKLADNEDSGYDNLDVDDVPEAPEEYTAPEQPGVEEEE